jgi:hypothetical protein
MLKLIIETLSGQDRAASTSWFLGGDFGIGAAPPADHAQARGERSDVR